MKFLRAICLLLLAATAACTDSENKPEDAVNGFLRAIHKHDCEKVFSYFSAASQEKVRQQSAQEIKNYPPYAEQFTPEKFYCTSVFANRFLTYNVGSAAVQSIEGENAVVRVTYFEGKNELIPGFFPTSYVKKSDTIQAVRENGQWKIDLVTPSPVEKQAIAVRERAKARDQERLTEARRQNELTEKRLWQIIHQKCIDFRLLARWSFQRSPEAGVIRDETGNFSAEFLGTHVVDLPEGRALQFQADKEAVRLPEDLLNNRACGLIMFWFRRDDANRLNRVLLKVFPGVFSETSIHVSEDGQIHYNMERATIHSNARLEPQKFYRLAFGWGENGMRIYIDGQLDAQSDKLAQIKAVSKLTELGRDPNDSEKTGSRMTIRDLQVYEGSADEARIRQLFAAE